MMEHSPSLIPFPPGRSSPTFDALREEVLVNPGQQSNANRTASHTLTSNLDGPQAARQILEVPSKSSSSAQRESLPSIHNLLHSIGQDETADLPAGTSRHSPSAPYLPSLNHFTTPSDHQSNGSSSYVHIYSGSLHHSDRPKTSTWEPPLFPVRSSSPQRRPPLAPSAFAHSQYIHHGNSRSDGGLYRPASASGGRSHRGVFAFISQGNNYKKQKSMHSPSSSITSIASEDSKEAPSLNACKINNTPAASRLMKRNLQSQQEGEGMPSTTSASRRRHTVGALEEPHGLLHTSLESSHDMAHQSRIVNSELTPRVASHQHMQSYSSRMEHPATHTTAGVINGRYQVEPRRDSSGSSISGILASHSSQNRVYLQQTEVASESLPSLSSSTSATSLSSDRVRLHSLEDLGERRMMPSAWGSAAETIHLDKSAIDHTLCSPRATNWHSRSSTLDSVESFNSLKGNQSPYNRPMLPPRSSSLLVEDKYDFTATPTRRARDMAAPYIQTKERTRKNSYRGGEVHHTNSMRAEPIPLNGTTSLVHPIETTARNRAQMIIYAEQAGVMHSPSHHHYPTTSNFSSPSSALMMNRSLSSHSLGSVASLPQRVSSMEINQDVGRVGQLHERIGMSSTSSLGTLPNANADQAGDVSTAIATTDAPFVTLNDTGHAGGPKYQCGWCGKRFSRPSSLKIHHHSHTGEKPFACPAPNCGRTFSVQSNLRRHQKCHSSQSSSTKGIPFHTEGSSVDYTSRLHEVAAPSTHHDERLFAEIKSTTPATTLPSNYDHKMYHFQQVAIPSNYSNQSRLAAMHSDGPSRNHQRYDDPPESHHHHHHNLLHHDNNSFIQSREQLSSPASSNAGDDLDNSEIADEDDQESMQDIREEAVVVASAPLQYQHQRSAVQDLLNP